MRECNSRLDFRQVDDILLFINSVFVCGVDNRFPVAVFRNISQGLVIHGKNTILCTGFNCHVGHGQPIAHGQASNAFANKFHRLVQSTIYANHADDVQDDILTGDIRVQLALQFKLDGRRYFKPSLTDCHATCHIGRTNTSGKCTQCTIGTGVRVCTDDNVTGNNQSFFRQQSVFNAHLTNVIEVGNFLFVAEIPAHFALSCSLNIFIWGKVIHYHGNFVLVENVIRTEFVEFPDGNRRGNVVTEYPIQVDQNQLTSFYMIQASVCSKDFLCHGHTHRENSSFIF